MFPCLPAGPPGHDRRYAIDCSKIENELGWRPAVSFAQGLRDTIAWYQSNADWVAHVRSDGFLEYSSRGAARKPA